MRKLWSKSSFVCESCGAAWQEKRTRDDTFTPFEGAPAPCKMMSMDDKKMRSETFIRCGPLCERPLSGLSHSYGERNLLSLSSDLTKET